MFFLHTLLKSLRNLRRLVQLLIKEHVEVSFVIVFEILDKTAIKHVAVDLQLPVVLLADHVPKLLRVVWQAYVALLALGELLFVQNTFILFFLGCSRRGSARGHIC